VDVAPWIWEVTIGATIVFFIFDIWHMRRNPHEPSMKECLVALSFYVGAAIVFGLGVWYFAGAQYGGEFFAGWLTEYSLSIDNLFIFIIIMGKFAVPRQYQQNALMIGIVLALIMRGIFIAVGAAAINQFSWVFYLFGAFLIATAVNLAREGMEEEQGYDEPRLVRFVRRHLPVSEEWNGVKFFIKENGKRLLTPMAMVVITLGMTDLLFALDSIPAIYGLTEEPYLVLTANVFALMGLRQLYFLIGGLLQRLVYLSYGLAFLLSFIGVKLILHAMHENEVPFINGGEPIPWAPEIPIWLSLVVILGTLVVTTVASLLASAGYQVTLADRSQSALDRIERNGDIRCVPLNIENSTDLLGLLNDQFAVISAAPFHLTMRIAEASRAARAHYLDLTEDVASTRRVKELAVVLHQAGKLVTGLSHHQGEIKLRRRLIKRHRFEHETADLYATPLLAESKRRQLALLWQRRLLPREHHLKQRRTTGIAFDLKPLNKQAEGIIIVIHRFEDCLAHFVMQ